MGKSHREGVLSLQVFESLIRSKHIATLRSYEVSSYNTIKELYSIWTGIAWDTIPSSIEIAQRKGVINQWLNSLLSLPVEEVLSACKELAAGLVSQRWSSYDDFKRHHRPGISFVGELLSPCKWDTENAVRWSDPSSFCRVRSFLLFPTRVTLRCRTLEDESVDHFLEVQEKVSAWTRDDDHKGRELRDIIAKWCSKSVVAFDERCHHGPGRTFELERKDASIARKYACLGDDSLLRYCGFENPFPKGNLTRTSKLICVPKDFSKYRTICAEPAVLQYCQQGVAKCLLECIGESNLSDHVSLKDQGPNQWLAQIGSLDSSFATVDLSDASDTVAWTLVRSAFSGTEFLRYFYACRSREVQIPKKGTLPLSSFATMGSALTFPVESIVFAAVVERAYVLCGVPGPFRNYRVYGDDIVCREAVFDCLMSLLLRYGFSVNSKKTFHGDSLFRESCGEEYLGGYVVSPLRVSRGFEAVSAQNRCQQYEERISLINRMFSYGYSTVRSFLLTQLRETFGEPLFSDDPTRTDCIYSPAATNFQAPHRFNTRLQRGEYLTMAVKPAKPLPRELDLESQRLFEWLRTKECGRDTLDVQCDIREVILQSQALQYDKPSSPTLSRVWRERT